MRWKTQCLAQHTGGLRGTFPNETIVTGLIFGFRPGPGQPCLGLARLASRAGQLDLAGRVWLARLGWAGPAGRLGQRNCYRSPSGIGQLTAAIYTYMSGKPGNRLKMDHFFDAPLP